MPHIYATSLGWFSHFSLRRNSLRRNEYFFRSSSRILFICRNSYRCRIKFECAAILIICGWLTKMFHKKCFAKVPWNWCSVCAFVFRRKMLVHNECLCLCVRLDVRQYVAKNGRNFLLLLRSIWSPSTRTICTGWCLTTKVWISNKWNSISWGLRICATHSHSKWSQWNEMFFHCRKCNKEYNREKTIVMIMIIIIGIRKPPLTSPLNT